MIKFAEDPELGKVVDMQKMKVWCFGIDPIFSIQDLKFAVGDDKFGQLCSFKFTSLNDSIPYKNFSIAFVGRTPGKHAHPGMSYVGKWGGNGDKSQWYILKHIDRFRSDVIDKTMCMVNYGFNVDKFFESDVFKLMLSKIQAAIEKGLTSRFTDFIGTLKMPKIDPSDEDQADESMIRKAKNLADRIRIEAKDMLTCKEVNKRYYTLKSELHDSDLDEEIEGEFKKKGIYADVSELKEDDVEEEIDETAFNFDKFDNHQGSITGIGLAKLLKSTAKYSDWNPVVVMDRKTNKFYNVLDAHIAPQNGGLVLQIDTSDPIELKRRF